MTRIERAKELAHKAHNSINHKRKYSGLPYWVHLDEVAELVASVTNDEDMIIAAFFHDVIEDVFPINPEYSFEWLEKEFGVKVAKLVYELTDEFVKEKYPKMNRMQRKFAERERLGKISVESKTIKLADFISNTADIVKNDPDFARVYLDEKAAILPLFTDADSLLFHRAFNQLNEGRRILGLTGK